MENHYSATYIKSGVAFIEDDLDIAESIISIEEGQTAYSKDPLVFYKYKIAKIFGGNEMKDIRYLFLEIHSTSPNKVRKVDSSKWIPLGTD
jgi:hypothetical protein